MSYATPAGVMNGFWRWAGVGILGLGVIALLIFGGHEFGWWLQAQDIQHQSNNIRLNYATQESDLQQVTNDIATISGIATQETQAVGQQLADLHAQALTTANQACGMAAQVSISFGADSGWVRTNCANGVVSATSTLRKS